MRRFLSLVIGLCWLLNSQAQVIEFLPIESQRDAGATLNKSKVVEPFGVKLKDKILYVVEDRNYRYLLSTDGTEDGAIQLTDFQDQIKLAEIEFEDKYQTIDIETNGEIAFFYKQSSSSGKYTYNLWRTDGTKEGTFALPIQQELGSRTNVYLGTMYGGKLFESVRTGETETQTFIINGEKDNTQLLDKNVSIFTQIFQDHSKDNKLLYYRFEFIDNEFKINPVLYLYDIEKESKTTIPFEFGSFNNILSYFDDSVALIHVMDSTKIELWKIDLNSLTSTKIFTSDAVDVNSENGRDEFRRAYKLKQDLYIEATNYKDDFLTKTSQTLVLQNGSTTLEKAYNFTFVPMVFKDKFFFFKRDSENDRLTNLFMSDGLETDAIKISSYLNYASWWDENLGNRRVPQPTPRIIDDKMFFFVRQGGSSQERRNYYSVHYIDGSDLKPKVFLDSLSGYSDFFKISDKYYFTDYEYFYEINSDFTEVKKVINLPDNYDRRFQREGINYNLEHVNISDVEAVNDRLLVVNNRNFEAGAFSNRGKGVLLNSGEKRPYGLFVGDNSQNLYYFDPNKETEICDNVIGSLSSQSPEVCTGLPIYSLWSQYPEVNLEWYRNDTLINTGSIDSLIVDKSGTFYSKVYYKECESKSNEVTFEVDAPNIKLSLKEFTANNGDKYYDLISASSGGYLSDIGDYKSHSLFRDEANIELFQGVFGPTPQGREISRVINNQFGLYRYEITDNLGCVGSDTITVGSSGNNGGLTATVSSPATITYTPQTITLTASTGTGYTYQWQKDGMNILGATSSTYEANETGNYSVIITSGGETATSNTITVTILTPVGIEPVLVSDKLEMNVFPNPTSERLTAEIKLKERKGLELVLRTVDGRILESWKSDDENTFHNHSFYINKSFSSQILYLEANTGNEQLTKKVMLK